MSVANPKIILASGSAARKMMLDHVGLRYTAIAADIDEEALHGTYPVTCIAQNLAAQKALSIAAQHGDALVIGSDQVLEFEGEVFSKARNAEEAREKLKRLRGKTHYLHSAVSVVRREEILFSYLETATLKMHDFDDDFLDIYMKKDPDALISCVGGYKIEGAGGWLFSSIEGDNFTIMGMPLLPLLSYLRGDWGITP